MASNHHMIPVIIPYSKLYVAPEKKSKFDISLFHYEIIYKADDDTEHEQFEHEQHLYLRYDEQCCVLEWHYFLRMSQMMSTNPAKKQNMLNAIYGWVQSILIMDVDVPIVAI